MRNFKHFLRSRYVFLAGATAASAQLVDGNRISVSVPNEFVLRDKTLPAGQYTIERTPITPTRLRCSSSAAKTKRWCSIR